MSVRGAQVGSLLGRVLEAAPFVYLGTVLGLLLLLLTSSCLQVYQRDPATISEVRQTIENRKADHRYLLTTMPEGATVTATIRRELEVLHESEIDRLNAWKWREEKKHGAR